MAEAKNQIIARIRACFRGENDFDRYKPQIIGKIKAGDESYITLTVDIIKKVFKDKKEDGFSKLFALFLLKESMDTKNPSLVKYVQKKILRRLGIMAQIQKGQTKPYFPPDTRDAVVDNFVQLLRECIWVWNEWFALDSQGKPTKYKGTYDMLKTKIKMPTRKVFFLDAERAAEDAEEEEKSIEIVENRTVNQDSRMQSHQQAQTPQTANKPQNRSEAPTPNTANQPSKFAEEAKREKIEEIRRKESAQSNQSEPFEEKIYKILIDIDNKKEALLDAMITNPKPDPEVVVALLTSLKESNKLLKSNANDLVSREFPHKEELTEQVLHDSDLITTLISEYQKCHQGKMTMEQYRAFVIKELFTEEEDESRAPGQPASQGRSQQQLEQEPEQKPEQKPPTPPPRNPPQAEQPPSAGQGFGIDDFESMPADTGAANPKGITPAAFETFGGEEKKKVEEPKERVALKPAGSRNDLNQSMRSVAGSQVSETESRRATRTFNDLFTSSKPERGRKIEVKRGAQGREVDEFARSFDKGNTSKVSGRGNERPPQQAGGQKRRGEIGFEDFDDFQGQTTEQINDSSLQSQSGQFDFDYRNKTKSPDERGARAAGAREASVSRSPNSRVLEGYNDEESMREASADKRVSTREDQQAQRPANLNVPKSDYQTDAYSYGNIAGVRGQTPKQPTKVGFGDPFDNEFGEIDFDAGDFGAEHTQPTNKGGFGDFETAKKEQNVSQPVTPPISQQPAYNQQTKPQITISTYEEPTKPQVIKQERPLPPPTRESTSSNQAPIPSLLDPSTLKVRTDPVATMQQNNNISAIERPSNTYQPNALLSTSAYSEDTHIMRQADQLLDRARKLTNYQVPGLFNTPGYTGTGSALGGLSGRPPTGIERPLTYTEPPVRDSFRSPMANNTFESLAPRPLSAQKFEPFASSLGRPAAGDSSLLGELRQARDFSQAYSTQYSTPGQRILSEGPRHLPLPPPAKYLNMGTPLMTQTSDLRRSQYSAASPARHDTSLTYGSNLKSSYYLNDANRTTPLAPPLSSRAQDKAYTTGSFPNVGENSDLSKAVQLIEKARKLREQSNKKNTDLKSSTYGDNKYSRDLRESRVDLRQSRLDQDNYHRREKSSGIDLRQSRFDQDHRREKSGAMRQSRIYIGEERESVRLEEERLERERRQLEEDKARFEEEKRKLEGARRVTIEDEIRKDYPGYRGDGERFVSSAAPLERRELSVDTGYLGRNIPDLSTREIPERDVPTRDVPIRDIPRDIRQVRVETAVPERQNLRESRNEPRRLLDVDGRVYEEVQRGIGRKPVYSEEPRLLEKKPTKTKESFVEGANSRGRSSGRRYETLGQPQMQVSFGNTMTSEATNNLRKSYVRETFVPMNTEPYKMRSPSPITAINDRNIDVVELKPNETLKIVERPVPGSASKGRNASRGRARESPSMREFNTEPAEYTSKPTTVRAQQSPTRTRPPIPVYSQTQTSPKPAKSQSQQLANEIKSQIEALKRSLVVSKRPSDTQETFVQQRLDEHVTVREIRAYEVPKSSVNNDMRRSRMERPGVRVLDEELSHRKTSNNIGIDTYTPPVEEQQTPKERRTYQETKNEALRLIQDLKRSNKVEAVGVRVPNGQVDGGLKVSRILYEEPVRGAGYEEEIGGRRFSVKELNNIPGVKLTVENSDIWEGSSDRLTRARTMEDSMREYRTGFEAKEKWGRAVNFDYYLFDQITNEIYSNSQGKDVDAFKGACLLNKAVVFDHPLLKVDVISRIESDSTLKLIMHYVNKTNQSLTGFTVDIMDRVVDRNPQVIGAALTPKYQLKQELFVNFFDYKSKCFTMQITFQHEGAPQNVSIPLPLTINKFMTMKSVESTEYKKRWKGLKNNAVKSKYRHINAKFLRSHTEINKYFDNALFDISPIVNPKRKRKYGGMFTLPDKKDYYIRITMDSSRVKFVVSSDSSNSQYCDWAVQYLSFLLTV